MSFITIIEDDEAFEWSPIDKTGVKSQSVFLLRKLPEEERKRLTRKYTQKKMWKGQRIEETDARSLTADSLDYIIVGWTGVPVLRKNEKGVMAQTEAPCERAYKLALPEWLKIEILEIGIGGDASSLTEEPEDPPSVSASTSTGSPRSETKKRAASGTIQAVSR